MRRGGARAKKPAAAGRGTRKEAADDHSEPEERTPTKRGISQSVWLSIGLSVYLCGALLLRAAAHACLAVFRLLIAVCLKTPKPAAAGTKDKSKPAAGKKGKTGPPAVVVGVSWPFTFEITSGT